MCMIESEMELEEEVDALKAMYCQTDEFQITEDSSHGRHIILNLKNDQSPNMSLQVNIFISSSYPVIQPEISLCSSQICRKDMHKLKEDVITFINENPNVPVLIDTVVFLSEHFNRLKDKEQPIPVSTVYTDFEDNVTLLHIDHMRARTQYVKFINKWTTELNIHGRLIFFNRLILILLIGRISNLKEYVYRNRNRHVDVDSKGQNCKERMLYVLCEIRIEGSDKIFTDFQEISCKTNNDVKKIFGGTLIKIYDNYVDNISGYGLRT